MVLGIEDTAYSAPLVLVPLKSELGDWFSDQKTVADATSALGGELADVYASKDEAITLANTPGFAGRARHQMPHCALHGVICNAMGRVVYFSVQGMKNMTSDEVEDAKMPGINTVVLDLMQLPWLVNINLDKSGVKGQMPHLEELATLPALVRLTSFAACTVRG